MLAVLPFLASAAVQITRGQLLSGIGGCIAAVPFACEAYARAPPSWRPESLPPLAIKAGCDDVVFVLHGAGGPDANSHRIAEAMQKRNAAAQIVEYIYAPFVGDQLQAPFNAMRVGDHLADELLVRSSSPAKRVHVVGISVGAFAADRLATRLALDGRCERVKLTLLDPFTARGLLGLVRPNSAYGVTTFGKAPRVVAESVFNRDDPVPSTNLPLEHAVNFDITNAAARARFTPLPGDSLHSWPAAWYGLNPAELDERGVAALALGSVTAIP